MASPYALDFSPVNQAIQNNQQNEFTRNKLGMEQERLGFEREMQPFKVQGAKQELEAGQIKNEGALAQRFGGIGQAILAEPDPTKQQAYLDQMATHPGMRSMLDKALPPGWQRNPSLVGHYTSQIALGYQDELDRRLKTAQVLSAEDQLSAVRQLRSEEGGYGATPGTARAVTPAGVPSVPAGPGAGGQTPAPASPPANGGQPQSPPMPRSGDNSSPALFNLAQQWQRASRMIASGVPAYVTAGESLQKQITAMWEKGTQITGEGNVMPIPGAAEAGARSKGMDEAATANAKYYDTLHKGLVGGAMIAAQQKQNIGIVKDLLRDPDFSSGSLAKEQLWYQRALATLNINPGKAAPREVFNQTMARILADQFSGLKSMASTTGETGARIFKPMLDMEEKAIASGDDTPEGIKRKIEILDQAGDLMMKWGDLADRHAMANGGRLDARFDTTLRGEIAKARISSGGPEVPQSTAPGGSTPAATGGITKDQLLQMPDGPIPGGQFVKRGTQLIPVSGPLGSMTNPHSNNFNAKPGEHYYFQGKLRRSTGWTSEEVPQ